MIRIRQARADDALAIAQVHVAAWHAALDAVVPALMADSVEIERYGAMWQSLLGPHADSHTTLVAAGDAEGLVGFATASRQTASIPGFDCELHTLYVAPAFQRRNIGCRLFNDLAAQMVADGCGSIAAMVIDTPQARGFFAAMGGSLAGAEPIALPPDAMAGDAQPVMDLFIWQPLMAQPRET
jgi:ribosomal protein S18 acetylase RimI-like enzyme